MDDKKLQELNEQMKEALAMIEASREQYGLNFGNITGMMNNASNDIDGNNYQDAIIQVLGAIAQLNNMAEGIMKQKADDNEK